MRSTLRRMIGSLASITPSCARRPQNLSDEVMQDRCAPQAGAPWISPIISYTQETHPMNIDVSRREAISGLAVVALVAGLLAAGLWNPLTADDPPAAKADDFSPYVTKDGGISL